MNEIDRLNAGNERYRETGDATRRNVLYGVERLKREFSEHSQMRDVSVRGAVYDIRTGAVEWL